MDRFMLKLKVGYPSRGEEREIMDRVDLLHPQSLTPVITPAQVMEAREIVNRHHGTIGLAPHQGDGTTVRITLPIVQPQEHPAPAEH